MSNQAPAPVTDQEAVRASVRQHYGELVVSGSSCCGPADDNCCTSGNYVLYSADELDGVPAAAAENAHGCGNPTAIANLAAGSVVLDLGSGGGIDVFLAARQVGPSGFVYGVDMTDEMLDLARRNAAQIGAENVEFRKGTIEALPLADASVDVIISNCVINLSPDKTQTLREAFRVLKPGGRLAVSDVVIDGTLDDLPVSEAQVRTALNWAGCIAGALTIDQFAQALEAAGFEAVDVEIKHRYSAAELGQEMAGADLALSPDVVAQLVNRFTSSNITARRPAA